MKYLPLEKLEFIKFLYHSIEEYADCMFQYGEFDSFAKAKQESKREVTALAPNYVLLKHHRLLKLVDENITKGYLWYILPRQHSPAGFLNYIAVDPKFRRQGYAKQIMAHYEDLLVNEHQLNQSEFFVFSGNTPAIKLYESLGYRVVERVKFNAATEPTRFKMTKTLC